MSDIFYRAIKAQDKLDDIMPHRNWPIEAKVEPPKHIVETIKLYRKGYTQTRIAKELGITVHSVKATVRRVYLKG